MSAIKSLEHARHNLAQSTHSDNHISYWDSKGAHSGNCLRREDLQIVRLLCYGLILVHMSLLRHWYLLAVVVLLQAMVQYCRARLFFCLGVTPVMQLQQQCHQASCLKSGPDFARHDVSFRFVLWWSDKAKGHLDRCKATADSEIKSQRADVALGGYAAAFACIVSWDWSLFCGTKSKSCQSFA